MKLFVFGVGYSVATYLRDHAKDWSAIAGTVRTPEKAKRVAATFPGIKAFAFDGSGAEPGIAEALAEADALLVSVPAASGDPALRMFSSQIAASKIGRIVYLSTLGVYGDAAGGWVDETTPVDPAASRGEARVAAETEWLALSTAARRVFVLRLAGIYGPGRNAIANLRDGTARRIVKHGQVFNRIHVEDIARAIAACMSTDHAGGLFNVCDDEPAPPQDVVTRAAEIIGIAPPPEIPFEQASFSPMAASFWTSSKRVSNRKLRQELGVELAYPTYREGLAALALEG